MYGDPDPYSTADKSQSYQSEYIGFIIACVAVCVTGAKTREEGRGVKGKEAEIKKRCPLFLFPLPLPFSLFPTPLKTAATQSNDLQ